MPFLGGASPAPFAHFCDDLGARALGRIRDGPGRGGGYGCHPASAGTGVRTPWGRRLSSPVSGGCRASRACRCCVSVGCVRRAWSAWCGGRAVGVSARVGCGGWAGGRRSLYDRVPGWGGLLRGWGEHCAADRGACGYRYGHGSGAVRSRVTVDGVGDRWGGLPGRCCLCAGLGLRWGGLFPDGPADGGAGPARLTARSESGARRARTAARPNGSTLGRRRRWAGRVARPAPAELRLGQVA